MSDKFAARVGDPTEHPGTMLISSVPMLKPVLIGGMPAWRAMPAAAVTNLRSAKDASDKLVDAAEKATLAASTPESKTAAKANEDTIKHTQAATMAAAITGAAGGADMLTCRIPRGIVPHGPGIVTEGARTVLINGFRAARNGDQLIEALGGPNTIKGGCTSVIIGGRE